MCKYPAELLFQSHVSGKKVRTRAGSLRSSEKGTGGVVTTENGVVIGTDTRWPPPPKNPPLNVQSEARNIKNGTILYFAKIQIFKIQNNGTQLQSFLTTIRLTGHKYNYSVFDAGWWPVSLHFLI